MIKTKQAARTATSIALAGALVFSGASVTLGMVAFAPSGSDIVAQAQAKTKNLKQAGAKFTLKKNKAFKSKMWFRGAGKKKYTIKVTDYKVKKVSKKKKKATFTITWTRKWAPTKKQVKKMVDKSEAREGIEYGGTWFVLADYSTGKMLERKELAKEYGIKCSSKFKGKKMKKYTRSDGYWVKLPEKITCKVSITFPKNYKGLCVGVGCGLYSSSLIDDEIYTDYDSDDSNDVNTPLYKTRVFKTCKKSFRFMRVK